jgi:hypothetical protein
MQNRRSRVSGGDLLWDSNLLLLLLLIGAFDPSLIGAFKRVADYSAQDHDILAAYAREFENLVATPHILTEVSNLANSLPQYVKPGCFEHFSRLIVQIDERHLPAGYLTGLAEFPLFGLTDAALSSLASTVVVATADGRLCSHLRRRGLQAVGFNEIRAHYRQPAE